VIVTYAGRRSLNHSEAVSGWHAREELPLALRVIALIGIPAYAKLPVDVNVLVMLKGGAVELPERLHHDRGGGYGGALPNWIRLWEVSATPILEGNRIGVMHLVPLMKHTREQAREAARRIKASGDENLMALFLALGGKVYDRDELERWLAVMNQAILEIASTTPFGQDLMEMGRAKGVEAGRKEGLREGRKEGRTEGRKEGLREADQKSCDRVVGMVRDLLQSRFPDLVDHPSLNKLLTSERAFRLLEGLLEAKSRKSVLEALSAV
jgi:hypothetical protein